MCRRILRRASFSGFHKGQSACICGSAPLYRRRRRRRMQSRNCSHAGNSLHEIPGVLLRDSFDFRFTGTRLSVDRRNGSESRACNYYNGRSARRYNLIWSILLWNAGATTMTTARTTTMRRYRYSSVRGERCRCLPLVVYCSRRIAALRRA